MPDSKDASVVIAAFNEEAVISTALDSLATYADNLDLEVIVVCNGCTDRTAELARAHGTASVVELSVASKVAALNEGDRVATTFPRLYLDADTVINADALESTIQTLKSGRVLAARPSSTHNFSGRTYLVSAYYRTREHLPSIVQRLWGAGIYGVSRAGRLRFESFPDYTADDLFVDRLFSREEIAIVACHPVVVEIPYSLSSLLRMLRRVYQGKEEQNASTDRKIVADLLRYAKSGFSQAADSVIYILIVLWARALRKVVLDERWGSGRSM